MKLVKDDFKRMDRKEKADFINSNLNQGMSFNDIYKATMHNSELAKSKEMLLEQFKKAGYQINKKNPEDETINELISSTELNEKGDPLILNSNKLIKILENCDDIIQMLEWWRNNNTNKPLIDPSEILLPDNGEDIRKTIRINSQVWDEWKTFCSKQSGLSEKDLMAKALLFYIRKG